MKVLVVDDEQAARYAMVKALRAESRVILEAADGHSAFDLIQQHVPDLVFLDLNMPESDGMDVLKRLGESCQSIETEIIVVTANSDVQTAVECVRLGAIDYLMKPYDVDHLRSIVKRTEKRVDLQDRVVQLEQSGLDCCGEMFGNSSVMRRLFTRVRKAAEADLPVLIRGESGTGKELVARALHQLGARSSAPFVAVNTAAIAESLIESELFGHRKGAFTGADRDRDGVFRQANGGTLFLDEIGDMPVGVQTRLLRVLQEGIVQPVGTEVGVKVDVRVISATHQDLEQSIAENLFRQDLYFRLKGIDLNVPCLRQRQEDMLLLARQFLAEGQVLSASAVKAIYQHEWPGNVRELKQRIQSASVMADNDEICAADLALTVSGQQSSESGLQTYLELPFSEAKQQLMADFERLAIQRALSAEDGNVSAAARRLGIHRQSLQQKIKQLDVV
ncbi:MAG: sigma-54 dependent transcriptional regulator [Fuerstiella sp.]